MQLVLWVTIVAQNNSIDLGWESFTHIILEHPMHYLKFPWQSGMHLCIDMYDNNQFLYCQVTSVIFATDS